MKNVHLLSTDKPSRLWINNLLQSKLELSKEFLVGSNTARHIYITSSDEGIKEGDWFIHPDSSCFDKEWKEISIGGYEILQVIKVDENFIYHSSMMAIHKNLNIKKIILTTDQDLIKDGVQPIEDYFLEWFVKNPSCEFVKVEEYFNTKNIVYGHNISPYKIIIPQEELKHPKVFSENGNELFFDEQGNLGREQLDYTALLQPVGTRQETLADKRSYQKHFLTNTKGYKLWCNIIQRCYNPKNHSYKYYGEKGVIMEDYFKNSYKNFINWIKELENYENWLNSSELSLDRIDNNLGYIRGNIKFSTKTEQIENQNLRVDNKSGYKGVCYHKLNKKYGATITINKSKIFLGYYETALEAALVYDNYILKNNLNRKTNL